MPGAERRAARAARAAVVPDPADPTVVGRRTAVMVGALYARMPRPEQATTRVKRAWQSVAATVLAVAVAVLLAHR